MIGKKKKGKKKKGHGVDIQGVLGMSRHPPIGEEGTWTSAKRGAVCCANQREKHVVQHLKEGGGA